MNSVKNRNVTNISKRRKYNLHFITHISNNAIRTIEARGTQFMRTYVPVTLESSLSDIKRSDIYNLTLKLSAQCSVAIKGFILIL